MNFNKIHGDDRGEIGVMWGLGCPEVSIFTTLKGKARGGCLHPESDEYIAVISGSIVLKTPNMDIIMKRGHTELIPRNTPHCFVAIEDCAVMEWGPHAREKGIKDPQMADYVKLINGGKCGADKTDI